MYKIEYRSLLSIDASKQLTKTAWSYLNCSNIQLTDTIISVQTTTDVSMFITNSSSIVNRNWIIDCVTSKKI